jgi:L-ribulokinase
MIMGTSTCHVLLGERPAVVEGMCGMVEDGVVPGLYGFEAGQSAVGDIFAWFAELAMTPHEVLERAAATLRPGQSGLLALDWWNGNRSVLVDADLRGLLVGMTLQTKPAEIYRALIEATAFGTRVIVEAFEAGGVPVDSIVACGGLPERNKLLMQIYADVLGREIVVGASKQAPALGAAMFGALAGGVYKSISETSTHMAHESGESFTPDAAAHEVYNRLYTEYVRLHDLFGRGDDVMRELKGLQAQVLEA